MSDFFPTGTWIVAHPGGSTAHFSREAAQRAAETLFAQGHADIEVLEETADGQGHVWLQAVMW